VFVRFCIYILRHILKSHVEYFPLTHGVVSGGAEQDVKDVGEEGHVDANDGRHAGEQRVAETLRNVHYGDRATGNHIARKVDFPVVRRQPCENGEDVF
jgi:hypothetical protein